MIANVHLIILPIRIWTKWSTHIKVITKFCKSQISQSQCQKANIKGALHFAKINLNWTPTGLWWLYFQLFQPASNKNCNKIFCENSKTTLILLQDLFQASSSLLLNNFKTSKFNFDKCFALLSPSLVMFSLHLGFCI